MYIKERNSYKHILFIHFWYYNFSRRTRKEKKKKLPLKSTYPMERDLSRRLPGPPSYFSGCLTPPTCFPICEEIEYSRLHFCAAPHGGRRSGWRWRSFLWRLVRDSKIGLCGSINHHKPISFHYDAVSYSQNFDEGCHVYEENKRRSLAVYRDVRWDLLDYIANSSIYV